MTSKACIESDNYLLINKSQCLYTSCFCEENVWKLCQFVCDFQKNHLNNCFVVFISNDKQMVPIWKQKTGQQDDDYLSIWDYHVIMVYMPQKDETDGNGMSCQVYDFDTVLSFPEDFQTYSRLTFRTEDNIKPEYRRMFRVISSEVYLQRFASNRCHMRRPDGSWIKTPPEYPCISTPDCDHNLDQFISMNSNNNLGIVLNLNQFINKFIQ